jgi:hypothetical protein
MGKHNFSQKFDYSSDEEEIAEKKDTRCHGNTAIIIREALMKHCKEQGLPMCEFLTTGDVEKYL